MSKFTGNIIRLPAVTPTQNSASGVYTLDDQFTAQSSGTWPIVRDQYFNYTTLLLTGAVQGTAYPNPVTQPYSFLSDASTNNFVVSPNGDVSARPFNPYLNNYSNYFSSASSYFTPPSSAIPTGAGTAFTIEAWVYPSASASTFTLIGIGSAGNFIDLYVNTNNQLVFDIKGTVNVVASPNNAITTNQWQHVVLTRTAGNLYTLYVNGTSVGTPAVNSTSLSSSSSYQLCAGNGYVSNLRVTTGAVVYSGSFTPPTSPLSATVAAGTVLLLTCQSNRFRDAGPSNLTLTVNGTPAVSQNSPFVSYDTTNGSGYFDGTGDYLTVASSTAFNIGTGAFTFDAWVYRTTSGSTNIFHGSSAGLIIYIDSSSKAVVRLYGVADVLVSVAAVPTNQWVHIAVARTGTTLSMWLNGSRADGNTTGSNSSNFGQTGFNIGCNESFTGLYTGYLSNIRLVTGSAVYDPTLTTITVPTAPLQAVTNTSLLTLQTRAPATNNGFIDSSPNNFVVTRNGNTTQGSFSPFSPTGWGNYFDGVSGTYLSVPRNSVFLPGASVDFTFEAWVYLTATPGAEGALVMGFGEYGVDSDWNFFINSSLQTGMWFGSVTSAYINTTQALTLNTWCHVAVSRSGTAANNLKVFVNGIGQSFSQNATTVSTGNRNLSIGADQDGTESRLTGYISNIRIINGQALYTGNFTPPTAAFTATSVGTTGTNVATSITGTVGLITCQSNRFVDTSPNNFTVTRNGGVSVQAFSPFAPAQSYIPSQIGGSGYFDGTGDYLATASDAAFGFGTGDFTVEAWVYITGGSGERTLLCVDATGGANIGLSGGAGSNAIIIGRRGVDVNNTFGATPVSNAWAHVAIARSGTSITCWVNGAVSGTQSQSNSINYSSGPANIGAIATYAGTNFGGYIGSCRIVKGTAVYNPSAATITVPTAPPTAIPNTSLLLNFTNGGIVDATGKNNLETVANSGVQTSQAKWSPGSMYFDGTSDQLTIKPTENLALGSGNYTIELWINIISFTAYGTFVTTYNNAATAGAWFFRINDTTQQWQWQNGANGGSANFKSYNSSTNLTSGTWHHLAVVRNNGVVTLYQDGQNVGGGADIEILIAPNFTIGRAVNGYELNGYIDDLRITKGVARYTSNFNTNLPSGPFPLG